MFGTLTPWPALVKKNNNNNIKNNNNDKDNDNVNDIDSDFDNDDDDDDHDDIWIELFDQKWKGPKSRTKPGILNCQNFN